MHQFRSTNKDDGSTILLAFSSVFFRFALGLSFLSAVADRFGFWGSFGEHHVVWGTFARFVAYTGQLNWFYYDPSHCRDLRRNHSCCSAAVGMADADRGSVKWSVASIVRSYDGGSSGDQGSSDLLSSLREWRSFCASQLHRISIQHRSTTTRFVWTSVGTLDLSA